jgi:hypothetical protein
MKQRRLLADNRPWIPASPLSARGRLAARLGSAAAGLLVLGAPGGAERGQDAGRSIQRGSTSGLGP